MRTSNIKRKKDHIKVNSIQNDCCQKTFMEKKLLTARVKEKNVSVKGGQTKVNTGLIATEIQNVPLGLTI